MFKSGDKIRLKKDWLPILRARYGCVTDSLIREERKIDALNKFIGKELIFDRFADTRLKGAVCTTVKVVAHAINDWFVHPDCFEFANLITEGGLEYV